MKLMAVAADTAETSLADLTSTTARNESVKNRRNLLVDRNSHNLLADHEAATQLVLIWFYA